MSYENYNDTIRNDNKTVKLALSAYEESLFKKNNVEKSQKEAANYWHRLKYLFAIFH